MCVVCLLFSLWIDEYVFWDNNVMFVCQMHANVCVSQDTSVEVVFNKVKT